MAFLSQNVNKFDQICKCFLGMIFENGSYEFMKIKAIFMQSTFLPSCSSECWSPSLYSECSIFVSGLISFMHRHELKRMPPTKLGLAVRLCRRDEEKVQYCQRHAFTFKGLLII